MYGNFPLCVCKPEFIAVCGAETNQGHLKAGYPVVPCSLSDLCAWFCGYLIIILYSVVDMFSYNMSHTCRSMYARY